MIIGVCGGSGSGKTTLLNRLKEHFKDKNPALFIMDNYYRPITEQQKDKNGIYNFDLPTALNKEQLIKDFLDLKSGKKISVKEYHFNTPPERHVWIPVEPSEIIIIEGLFVLHYPEIRQQLDFSVFIEVDLNVQLDRRLYRDQETRGYSREDIIYQWDNHVLPCYEKYLLPYKETTDFIFHNDERADEEFQRLISKLEDVIKMKNTNNP